MVNEQSFLNIIETINDVRVCLSLDEVGPFFDDWFIHKVNELYTTSQYLHTWYLEATQIHSVYDTLVYELNVFYQDVSYLYNNSYEMLTQDDEIHECFEALVVTVAKTIESLKIERVLV